MPVPRLQARIDSDVDGDDWVALVIDHVDGAMPERPWRPAELASCPRGDRDSWRVPARPARSPGSPPPPAPLGGLARLDAPAVADLLDPWSRDHLAELIQLEAGWRDAIVGDTLLQFDTWAHNMLLGDDPVPPRLAALVAGAPWVDLLAFLPSAVLDGAPDPEAIWLAHPLGAAAEPARADAVLAAFTGYFLRQSTGPRPRSPDGAGLRASPGRFRGLLGAASPLTVGEPSAPDEVALPGPCSRKLATPVRLSSVPKTSTNPPARGRGRRRACRQASVDDPLGDRLGDERTAGDLGGERQRGPSGPPR